MSAAPPAAWIVRPRPRPGARLHLLCFPHAGGAASAYHGWGGALPEEIEVWAVQPPGHETRMREPLPATLEALVEDLARALAPALDGRFAFFGHSLGALVAFELARTLRRKGQRLPERLLVSGRSAPQVVEHGPAIEALPDERFLDALSERYGGIPEAVRREPELVALFLPILRADWRLAAAYSYRAEAPLPCPIAAFGGLDDTTAPVAAIAAWREQTAAAFSQHMLPGGHFFALGAPPALLGVIAGELGTRP